MGRGKEGKVCVREGGRIWEAEAVGVSFILILESL